MKTQTAIIALAATLARSLGFTRGFWLNREAHYRVRLRQLRDTGRAKKETRIAFSG